MSLNRPALLVIDMQHDVVLDGAPLNAIMAQDLITILE